MAFPIMTVDLEPDLRSATCKSMEAVVPRLLKLFEKHNITATFFVVTSLLEMHEKMIREIAKKHEIASHGDVHEAITPETAWQQIETSRKKLLEKGFSCDGFRAPMFMTTKDHLELVKKARYTYDASFARWLPGRYSHLSIPGKPFITEGIWEFPTPTFLFPLVNAGLPYLKMLHPLSRVFSQQYLFYLHPWEFLEKNDLPPALSFSSHLLQRNCGERAWQIFEDFLKKEQTEWVSCKIWIENQGKPTSR